MNYFAKQRCRVSALLLLWLFAASSRAEAGWLEQCARFFGALAPSPVAKREASRLSQPSRKQKILVRGARGPGEPALRSYINEANALLTDMAVPPHLEVSVTGKPMENFYDPEQLQIVLPAQYANDFSKETEAAKRSFLQHEYGHAVFDENFAQYSTEWQNWLSETKNRGAFSPEGAAPFPHILREATRPYQELFADLLTVAAQNDPIAISHPLHRYLGQNDPRLLMRSFDDTVFGARWNEPEIVEGEFGPVFGSSPQTAPASKVKKLRDDHIAFAPVRAYLWENFFSRPDLAAHRSKMLKVVFDTIAREILARQADPRLHNLPFSVASARLLRALDGAMAGYKLK